MEKNEIQIKTKSEDLKGVYSNLMMASSKKEEFVLDFLMLSSLGGGVLSSRIIVSPDHLKKISKVLQDEIKKYEEKFGEIKNSEKNNVTGEKIGFVTE